MLSSRTRDSLAPLAVMLAIVTAILLLFSRFAHASVGPATPTPAGVDWSTIVAIVAAVLSAASIVLHVVAPRTKATWDDALRDDVDWLLARVRDVGGSKPTTDTPSNVVPLPRDKQAGGAS